MSSRLCFFIPDPANPSWYRAVDAFGAKEAVEGDPAAFPALLHHLPKTRKPPEVFEAGDIEEALYYMLEVREDLKDKAISMLASRFVLHEDFRKAALENVLAKCPETTQTASAGAFRMALSASGGGDAVAAVALVFKEEMPGETLAQWFARAAGAAGTNPEKMLRNHLHDFTEASAYRIGDPETAPVWVHEKWVRANAVPLKTRQEYERQRNIEVFGNPAGPSAIRLPFPPRLSG